MIPHKYWFILKPHLAIWLTAWLAGAFLVALQGYNQSFLTLNALHLDWLDPLMPHLTHLGDGVLPVTAFALMIAHRERGLILSTTLALIAGLLITTVLKFEVFPHFDRPPVVFGGEANIHYITLQNEHKYSFPSGHSMASALTGIFCALSFHHFRRWWSVVTALIAIGVCYTRIYIGVHFLGDVVVGSAIGLLLGVGVLCWVTPALDRWFARMKPVYVKGWSVFLYLLAIAIMVYDVVRLSQFY